MELPGAGRHAVAEGICASISTATVAPLAAEDALKPWQYRSWIFITDPDFAARPSGCSTSTTGCGTGNPWGATIIVISADEKTSIQARCRCHPTLPPGKSRTMRVNHDYHRRGALAYLAAYDVHRATVFGRCEDRPPASNRSPPTGRTGHDRRSPTPPPIGCSGSSTTAPPTAAKPRSTGSAEQYPNAIMVHTPVHASWLNQVEIYFSIVQRKVVSPNDFTDLDGHRTASSAFEARYNETARPFKWKFTTTDLADLLDRLDQHNPPGRKPCPTPSRMNPRRTYGPDHLARQRHTAPTAHFPDGVRGGNNRPTTVRAVIVAAQSTINTVMMELLGRLR